MGRRGKFGRRGNALWRDVGGDRLPPMHRVLLEEACRLADRLDRLEQVLSGDRRVWLEIVEGDAPQVMMVVDDTLTHARLHASTLKQIVAELRQVGSTTSSGGGVLDQLAARRAARHADASGR